MQWPRIPAVEVALVCNLCEFETGSCCGRAACVWIIDRIRDNSGVLFLHKVGTHLSHRPSAEILIATDNTRSRPWTCRHAKKNFLASCSNTISLSPWQFSSPVRSAAPPRGIYPALSKHCDPTPRRTHRHCHASQVGGCNRRVGGGGT